MINRMEKIVDEMEKTYIAQNSKSITSDMNIYCPKYSITKSKC